MTPPPLNDARDTPNVATGQLQRVGSNYQTSIDQRYSSLEDLRLLLFAFDANVNDARKRRRVAYALATLHINTLCLKKTSPTFSATTRGRIIRLLDCPISSQ